MLEIYIVISIIVLVVIAIYTIYTGKSRRSKQFSKLAMCATLLVVLGIIFGENRLAGYLLMGAGVILSIVDIIKNSKSK